MAEYSKTKVLKNYLSNFSVKKPPDFFKLRIKYLPSGWLSSLKRKRKKMAEKIIGQP